jgi:hypothetical protein
MEATIKRRTEYEAKRKRATSFLEHNEFDTPQQYRNTDVFLSILLVSLMVNASQLTWHQLFRHDKLYTARFLRCHNYRSAAVGLKGQRRYLHHPWYCPGVSGCGSLLS